MFLVAGNGTASGISVEGGCSAVALALLLKGTCWTRVLCFFSRTDSTRPFYYSWGHVTVAMSRRGEQRKLSRCSSRLCLKERVNFGSIRVSSDLHSSRSTPLVQGAPSEERPAHQSCQLAPADPRGPKMVSNPQVSCLTR